MSRAAVRDLSAALDGAARPAARARASLLLVCGLVAGPLFVVSSAVQAATRDGFDLSRHPVSALVLGAMGWVQVITFVASGALTIAFAVGVRRALGGRGRIWAPRLLAVFGGGLIVAGAFQTDPAYAFPPGTPDRMPEQLSWHAIVHGLGFAVAFVSVTASAFVVAAGAVRRRERAWAAASVALAVVGLTLSAWPGTEGASVRYAIAACVVWAWTFALARRLIRTEAGV